MATTTKLSETRQRLARPVLADLERYASKAEGALDADTIEATELRLALDNCNAATYRHAVSYGELVVKRILAGDWDTAKAVEGLRRGALADTVRQYRQDNATPDWSPSVATKRIAAAEWLLSFVVEWALGNY